MKVLILGATGMLGSAVYRILSRQPDLRVYGTLRSAALTNLFAGDIQDGLTVVEDLENLDNLMHLFDTIAPDVVINCTSQGAANPDDPMKTISIFSILPQRLLHLCQRADARLVQISSDGVFSGRRGQYSEDDLPDADDIYGISKLLGEVTGPNAITLRTSIIGHQLQGSKGLLEWFLSQADSCNCYSRAIFSGFPTVVLAEIIRDVIIPQSALNGLYHVATQPISKYALLELVAERYGKTISLISDATVAIDRSLIPHKFNLATGYVAPEWSSLIDTMYKDKFGSGQA